MGKRDLVGELYRLVDNIMANYGHLVTVTCADFELVDGEWAIEGMNPHEWIEANVIY